MFVTAWQIHVAAKTNSLQSLEKFFDRVTEREHAFIAAPNDASREQAFNEFLNFLEIYAAASNKGLVTGVAAEMIDEKIVDSFVMIELFPQWHGKLVKAITSHSTLMQLRKFLARWKVQRQLAHRRVTIRATTISGSS